MPTYKAPLDDTLFILNEVLRVTEQEDLPGAGELTQDLMQAILEEGARFVEEVRLPAPGGWLGACAAGFQGGLPAVLCRRLARSDPA
jgi:hypothetical protein